MSDIRCPVSPSMIEQVAVFNSLRSMALTEREIRHPAVLAALRDLDTWTWRRLPDADARKQFSVAWKAVVERVRADGIGSLPDVPAGIEHDPAGVPVEREHARDRLAEIMGVLTE